MRPSVIKQRDVAPVQTFARAAAKCSAEVSTFIDQQALQRLCARLSSVMLAIESLYVADRRSTSSEQARVYGACVTANYENIERNMCQKEFLAFKACVQQKVCLSPLSLTKDGQERQRYFLMLAARSFEVYRAVADV